MIPNNDPKLCATFTAPAEGDTPTRLVYVKVVAFDEDGYALIPGLLGRLVRAKHAPHMKGPFAGLRGLVSHIEAMTEDARP